MLKCGFYEREITPPIGSDIPGYNGFRDSTIIRDPLFVKAAAINAGERMEDNIILIVMDALVVPPSVYDRALEKIEKVIGVPPKNILLAATHSHTAGPIYPTSEFRRTDENWIAMLEQYTADCAIMAYYSMQPATARHALGQADGLGFCRDYLMKDGNIRTNPGWHNPDIERVFGKSDPDFPVVFFFDENGKPIGAITNFACHHDCKAGTEISSDYSGVLAKEMKKAFGLDFVNLLFSGACGNINHVNPFSEKEYPEKPEYIRIGEALAKEELRLFEIAKPLPIDGVDSVKGVLPVPRREVTPERLEEAYWLLDNVPLDFYQLDIAEPESQMFKRCKAEDIIAHAKKPKNLSALIQVVKLGECTLFALPGEIYSDFGFMLKENSPTEFTMISTLSNKGIDSYVPVPEVFHTTVYAAQLPSSPLIPEAGSMMVDFALKLAEKLK